MDVDIVKADKGMPLPKYETEGATAFDFVVKEETVVEPGTIKLIPTGVIIKVPEGYMLAVVARSSTGRKKGLLVPFGIIDNDYFGPEDEIFIQAYNISKSAITVERGDRIAQGVFIKIEKVNFKEKEKTNKKISRRSGSTG